MTTLDERWWSQVLCGADGDLHAGSSTENYLLLPNAVDPRVIVDTSSQQAMRDAVHRYLGTKTGALAGPLAGGVSKVIARKRVDWRIASSHRTLREHLSEVLDTDVRLSVAVGPPRVNRKPIVRCYADDQLIAVVKMGPEAHTAAMVVNEAEWLDYFSTEPLVDVATPEVLHRGEYGDSKLLVMSAFATTRVSAQGIGTIPLSLTRSLCDRFSTGTTVVEGPWWGGIHRRLERADTQRFLDYASALSNDDDFCGLTASIWHGDWSPWNIGTLRDGRHIIWDWERASIGVPLGFDLLHMHHQYGDGISNAAPGLQQLGVENSGRNGMEIAYMLELVARHAEAGMFVAERRRELEYLTEELMGKSGRSLQ